ncbi:hypothetical protein [Terriglobus sp. RCC_193]|uniref:Nmad2 family putative nucleotide modification protein n=1 Tax=Terriglobus sp. RCC_193 TaxID=3239218 RepID=UPI00352523BB
MPKNVQKLKLSDPLFDKLKSFDGRLYSYVVAHDIGFAPNPYFGFCTLACCKPTIRKHAREGDWIVGLTSRENGTNRIVYFMRVDERLESFESYWKDPRFESKKRSTASDEAQLGDNIYKVDKRGNYTQVESKHSDGPRENTENKERDLKGKAILVGTTFTYFGENAVELPPELQPLVIGRGHRSHFDEEVRSDFVKFVCRIGIRGKCGNPAKYRVQLLTSTCTEKVAQRQLERKGCGGC